jgi:RimJ/RimL family protein N-acetyltransferase
MQPASGHALETPRLWLRSWREADLAAFAALNADPAVMAHLPGRLARAESDALAARIVRHMESHGFGLWAVEVKGGAAFAGFTGLQRVLFDVPFAPCVEVGWRLARAAWGNGYAHEAASAALSFGFDTLGQDEIVSFTVPANERSWSLMRRLGMTHDPADDFDHPRLPEGHPLRRHVLYRLSRARWEARAPIRK